MKASWNKENKKEYDRVYKAAEWADPVKRAILKARHKKGRNPCRRCLDERIQQAIQVKE